MSPDAKYPTAEAAERAFYEAFANGDLYAMMDVWDETEDIVCVHPLGDVIAGRTAVAHSWEQIFSGGGVQPRIEVRIHERFTNGEVAVHTVYESFDSAGSGDSRPSVIATNSYRYTHERGWRLVLHHASPTPRQVRDMFGRERPAEQPPRTVH